MVPEDESSTDPPTRELMEWVAALVIVVALALVAAQSFGFAEINDSTLRIVFTAGLILFGGPKAIRVLAEAIAEFLK
jgi:Na+/pantothenate symporter